MIRNLQTLEINWINELYKVTSATLAVADSRRSCWICGCSFKIGDGMTVAQTDRGNKLMHTRCWCTQDEGG